MGRPDVFDYSGWRPDPTALRAAGVVGVCRYLAPLPGSAWKVITKPEYVALLAAGLQVVLNWEQSATDWQTGYPGGLSAGRQARAQARAVGHPDSRPIPFSVDQPNPNLTTAREWVRGCVDGSGTGPQIVYGSGPVIDACWSAGLVIGGWHVKTWGQTVHALLEQQLTKSYPQFPSSQYDENIRLADDWGQHPLGDDMPLDANDKAYLDAKFSESAKDAAGKVWATLIHNLKANEDQPAANLLAYTHLEASDAKGNSAGLAGQVSALAQQVATLSAAVQALTDSSSPDIAQIRAAVIPGMEDVVARSTLRSIPGSLEVEPPS